MQNNLDINIPEYDLYGILNKIVNKIISIKVMVLFI